MSEDDWRRVQYSAAQRIIERHRAAKREAEWRRANLTAAIIALACVTATILVLLMS